MTTQNPFDLSKLMEMFDPQKMMDQFNQTMGQLKLPEFDFQAMLESQRKNLDAVTEANRSLIEGTEALLKRQAELFQEAAKDAVESMSSLTDIKPEEIAAKQAELFTQAYDKASESMREIAEILRAAQENAIKTMDERVREGLAELKALASRKDA